VGKKNLYENGHQEFITLLDTTSFFLTGKKEVFVVFATNITPAPLRSESFKMAVYFERNKMVKNGQRHKENMIVHQKGFNYKEA
jgi:hypothetical protein